MCSEIQDQIDGGGQQELADGVGVLHPPGGEGPVALAALRPLPDLSLLELPSSQDAQMHVLCRCARSLRSTRAPGLRWRRARFGLAKGCQQHQVKVMEGFGYTVASLPCSEHTHSHLPGQPSSPSPAIWQIRPGDDPRQGAWPAGACLPAFRAAISVSTTSTTGNGGSEGHPFLQRRSCAASTDAVSCRRRPKAAPGGVRWLGGSSAAARRQRGCLPHPWGWSKADLIRGSG